MKNTFTNRTKEYEFVRYPKTNLSSLQAWNAADEYILEHFETLEIAKESLTIYNDRFGFLTCNLSKFSPNVIINFASQKKAIVKNLERNRLSGEQINFVPPLTDPLKKTGCAILKIPKSMNLFRLQLAQINESLDENGSVLCGFMTKYFTKQILAIAGDFFESVEQSIARKKSRVMTLMKPRQIERQDIVNSIDFDGQIFRQYFGVFSANNVDYASQFFIENWRIKRDEKRVLDLASGNGFLGKIVRLLNDKCELHLMDDDWLAVESSKFNFEQSDENTYFHFNDSLEKFEDAFFDLIVCNPPFHFEHETNIEVAIDLFEQAKRCLSKDGSFQLVANRHLNYKTHLTKLFNSVELIKRNKKFEIYRCKI